MRLRRTHIAFVLFIVGVSVCSVHGSLWAESGERFPRTMRGGAGLSDWQWPSLSLEDKTRRSSKKTVSKRNRRNAPPTRISEARLKRSSVVYELKEGSGYRVNRPERAFGTFLTVTTLENILADYHQRYPDGDPIDVRDLSRRGGGRIAPHKSHRTGRDVDISYIKQAKFGAKTKLPTHRTIDLERNWFLIKSFIDTNSVEYVFVNYRLQRMLYAYAVQQGEDRTWLNEIFQYPRGRRTPKGIIRHSRGHGNHLHIRFRADDSTSQVPHTS